MNHWVLFKLKQHLKTHRQGQQESPSALFQWTISIFGATSILFLAIAIQSFILGHAGLGERQIASEQRQYKLIDKKALEGDEWFVQFNQRKAQWEIHDNEHHKIVTIQGLLWKEHSPEESNLPTVKNFRFDNKLVRSLKDQSNRGRESNTFNIILSDLPEGVLKYNKNPLEHLLQVEITRIENTLELDAKKLSDLSAGEIYSLNISNFTSPQEQVEVVIAPSDKSNIKKHSSPHRGLSAE